MIHPPGKSLIGVLQRTSCCHPEAVPPVGANESMRLVEHPGSKIMPLNPQPGEHPRLVNQTANRHPAIYSDEGD